MDIEKRLRDWGTKDSLPAEAADEIRRLRTDIAQLKFALEQSEAAHLKRGRHLQRLAARLGELLDEDHWAECEELLLAADVTPNAEITGGKVGGN